MKLHLYLAAILLAGSAKAQLIISTYKAVTPVRVDSCLIPVDLSALSSMSTPVSNGSWNLSTVNWSTTPVVYAYKAKTAGFSNATYVDSNAVAFKSSTLSFTYNTWNNIQQTSTATNLLGDEILKRQAKSLAPATGNSLDSIVFPAQAVVYSRPLPIIKFPTTSGSVWLDSTVRSLNFNLTVTAAAVSNAPGQHVQRIKTVDSVVGWGSMKVPLFGKIGSSTVSVLQVHHYQITVDSFYLNGAPASSAPLALLGMSQGQTTTTAGTHFLRASAVRPLLQIVNSGATHSSTISRAYYNIVDLDEDVSVNTASLGTVKVYPNPVRGGQLSVDAVGNKGTALHYALADAMGRKILEGELTAAGGKIPLRQSMAPGIYYLQLSNAAGEPTTIPVDIQ